MKRDGRELEFQAMAHAIGFGAGVYCTLSLAPIPWEIIRHAEVAALIVGVLMYPVAHVTLCVIDAGCRRGVAWWMSRLMRLNRRERELVRSHRLGAAALAYRKRTGCTEDQAWEVVLDFKEKEGAA